MEAIKVKKFEIQQIALNPANSEEAISLLRDLGLDQWVTDNVTASGAVFGINGTNVAELNFNYQAGSGSDVEAGKPLELEVLHYEKGNNWLQDRPNCVSHLGMHVTNDELLSYRAYFASRGIAVAQEVMTQSHSNEAIKDERRYNYVIFDTYALLGVDLKFIVRLNTNYTPYVAPTVSQAK